MVRQQAATCNYRILFNGLFISLFTNFYGFLIVGKFSVTDACRETTRFLLQTSAKSTFYPEPFPDAQKNLNSVTEKRTKRLIRNTAGQAMKRTISGKVLVDTLRGYFTDEPSRLISKKATRINRPGKHLTDRLVITQSILYL
jgi:hypothetical protein